jgi:hypothetical protein
VPSPVLAAVLTAVLTGAAGCLHAGGTPPAPDVDRPKVSAHGRYRVAVRPDSGRIPLRRLHAWTLHLETAGGTPVDSAAVAVDGDMPAHGHGLPTRPRVVAALGDGDHRVAGLKFSMRGWWRVRFAVRGPAGADTVVFHLHL